MTPDGKATIVNLGTVEKPEIHIGPVGTTLEEFVAAMNRAGRSMEELGQFLDWYSETPQQELQFRLNCRLAGEDPGEPLNRGADGWRVY